MKRLKAWLERRIPDDKLPTLSFVEVSQIEPISPNDPEAPKVFEGRTSKGQLFRMRRMVSLKTLKYEWLLCNDAKEESEADAEAVKSILDRVNNPNPDNKPVYRVVAVVRNGETVVAVPVVAVPAEHTEEAWSKVQKSLTEDHHFPETFTFSLRRAQRVDGKLEQVAEQTTRQLQAMFLNGQRPDWYPTDEEINR